MKRLLALAVAAAVFAVPAAGAGAAASPTMAQFNALKKQVTSLKKQVTALQKQVKETNDLAFGVGAYSICLGAVAADALQGTWQAVDQREQSQSRQAIFGTQTPINEANLCQRGFSVSRSHTVPPNTGVFAALNAAFGVTYGYTAVGLLLSS